MAVRRSKLSARVISVLRAKAKKKKGVTLGMLKTVFKRGTGAYLSSGSRPRIGMQQWAYARVNSFCEEAENMIQTLEETKKR